MNCDRGHEMTFHGDRKSPRWVCSVCYKKWMADLRDLNQRQGIDPPYSLSHYVRLVLEAWKHHPERLDKAMAALEKRYVSSQSRRLKRA